MVVPDDEAGKEQEAEEDEGSLERYKSLETIPQASNEVSLSICVVVNETKPEESK